MDYFFKNFIVIKSNQNAWLKPYVDMNADLTKKQKNSFYLILKITQEKAMRYNKRDDLRQLSFTLKISIFSEVYI